MVPMVNQTDNDKVYQEWGDNDKYKTGKVEGKLNSSAGSSDAVDHKWPGISTATNG